MTYASGIKNRVGQYLYADGAITRRTIKGTEYVIGIAGAYDAFGLIGSEHNGIFVLNDTDKCVVLDRHEPTSSGYSGPSAGQRAEFDRIRKLSAKAFIDFIHSHPRSRLAARQEA